MSKCWKKIMCNPRNFSFYHHEVKSLTNVQRCLLVTQSCVYHDHYIAVKFCGLPATSQLRSSIVGNVRYLRTNQNLRNDIDTKQNENANSLSAEDIEKKKQLILMEYEMRKSSGEKAPSKLMDYNVEHMLKFSTRSQREKYLGYLLCCELDKEKSERRKQKKREEIMLAREKKQEELLTNNHIVYGLGYNTMFIMIRNATMSMSEYYRMMYGILYGQKIVIDMSYDDYMGGQEACNTAKQLKDCFAFNKYSRDPYHLHFCNVQRHRRVFTEFQKLVPFVDSPKFLCEVTEKSYLDYIPKEKLVYLTPNAENVLHKFDDDSIYIIGALVDKTFQKPVSMAKAKREGIKMAKLPLDYYLDWGSGGNKSLTLDQVMKIMLDIKIYRNWDKAFKHVPRRKLKRDNEKISPLLRNRSIYGNN
ncbi:TRMT10C (predicted) [Pycnogonum litorale]